MKTCIKCGELKPYEEYYQGGTARDGRFTECKSCNRARAREWQRARRATDPRYATNIALKSKYGISLEQYEAMLLDQGGCAICGAQEAGGRGQRFHVDHNHMCCPGQRSCGECVRGLLCHGCNTGIGALGENVERLMAAAAYLLARQHVLGEVLS